MTRRGGALRWCLALLWSLVFAPATGAQPAPMAWVAPAQAGVGDRVTITGQGWPAGTAVLVTFGDGDYMEWVRGLPQADGTLALSAVVPRQFTAVSGAQVLVRPGDYLVNVISAPGAGRGTLAVAARLTIIDPAPLPPVVAPRFRDYYFAHDGGRLLGAPQGDARLESSRRVQYFEKGRLEDHADQATTDPAWRYQFGRLAAELVAAGGPRAVGGDRSSLSYADLRDLSAPELRQPPPPGWDGIRPPAASEPVFVPFDAALRAAPGHEVPARFWGYINQPALFPSGWLHDIGLPLTAAVTATVTKTVAGEAVERVIVVQAFERTILTDDPANPDAFQIERANVGTDYLAGWRGPVVPGDVVLPAGFAWSDPQQTAERLPLGMQAPAWEWVSRPNGSLEAEGDVMALEHQLRAEGWLVAGRAGSSTNGAVEAVKGPRLHVITWSREPLRGTTTLRVLVGERL